LIFSITSDLGKNYYLHHDVPKKHQFPCDSATPDPGILISTNELPVRPFSLSWQNPQAVGPGLAERTGQTCLGGSPSHVASAEAHKISTGDDDATILDEL
jgi:hypothetical protein